MVTLLTTRRKVKNNPTLRYLSYWHKIDTDFHEIKPGNKSRHQKNVSVNQEGWGHNCGVGRGKIRGLEPLNFFFSFGFQESHITKGCTCTQLQLYGKYWKSGLKHCAMKSAQEVSSVDVRLQVTVIHIVYLQGNMWTGKGNISSGHHRIFFLHLSRLVLVQVVFAWVLANNSVYYNEFQ